jgi:hypothetical protein
VFFKELDRGAGSRIGIPEILPDVPRPPSTANFERLVGRVLGTGQRPTWGIDNRTVSLRVIPGIGTLSTRPGNPSGGPHRT